MICTEIVNFTVEFLELNKDSSEYLQALWTVATSFLTDYPIKKMRSNTDLYKKFILTSKLLGVEEEQLEFLLDLISGSPYRLFKVIDSNADFTELTSNFFDKFDKSRFEIIRLILGWKDNTLQKLYSIWCNSYKLVCSDETIKNTFSKLKLWISVRNSIIY